jgi:nickel-dependent lactate racemase
VPDFEIPYGSSSTRLSLPDGIKLRVLEGKPMGSLPDLRAHLRKQLASPTGAKPLSLLARDKRSATIVIGDPLHYNGYEHWLAVVLDELNSAGIPDDKITLYLASGVQGALSDGHKAYIFGESIVRRVKMLDHDCDAQERMAKVGRTPRGTQLSIDKRVLDADLLMLIGGVTYHYFSGYSGGPKSVMPGCASRESILQNSRYAIDPKTGDIHNAVGPGIIVGNPVSEDMHQCMGVVKPDICINVVLNESGEVCALYAGDPSLVLRYCAKFLDEHHQVQTEPGDIVVIGAGGGTKDATLFQAYKSLRHSVGALAQDASVIWLAECSQGEGGTDLAIHRGWTTDEMREQLKRDPAPVTFCALMMRKLSQRYDVHLVSSLDQSVAEGWGFTPHRELNEAISAVVRKRGFNERWLVGPDLSNLLPVRPGSNLREGQF